jgi:PAS domain S-box-containing protein
VDDLLQAGFALLARKVGERDARELASVRGVSRVFRDLSGRLAAVDDLDGVVRVLKELGTLTGLTRLELLLPRGGPAPIDASHREPPRDLETRVCLSGGRGDEQILMPLVSRHHAHGFVLLEASRADALVFDTIRDQLSQTLGTLLLGEERARAQQALRESEQRFRALADAAPMMVIETDPALAVTYVNPAAREGLGLDGGPGSSLRAHLGGPDEALAQDLLRRIGNVDAVSYPGLRLVNRAGRRYVPVVQVAAVRDAGGAVAAIRWHALDPLPLLASGMLPDPAFFAERKLTGREQEVIGLLVQGFRIRDMADRLAIAESTVKGHLTQIYDKLGISGRDGLLQLIQDEQVRRHGFSAYVFGLVSRLLRVDDGPAGDG